jgi:hypothetical protein
MVSALPFQGCMMLRNGQVLKLRAVNYPRCLAIQSPLRDTFKHTPKTVMLGEKSPSTFIKLGDRIS